MKRFRYQLGPVLSIRRWDLQDAQVELGEINAQVARQEAEAEAIATRQADAQRDWAAMMAPGRTLQLEALMRRRAHAAVLETQARRAQEALAGLEQERVQAAARVAACQRAVEALEDHRDGLRARFDQAQANAEYKAVDDHWNAGRTRRGSRDERNV